MVQLFFVNHGSRYIKAHTCRVQPTTVINSNIIETEVRATPAQLKKPEAKPNEKPTINNENESDGDDYSEGNQNILKDN